MISYIHNEEDKQRYLAQMAEIDKTFAKQASLPKEARVNISVINKLEKLHQHLENEICKYNRIQEE